MNKPTVFLKYYNPSDEYKTFQDILQEDIPSEILEKIKESLKEELLSNKIHEILPNFNWENPRMKELWEQLSASLILQIQLPNQIWQDWINELNPTKQSPENSSQEEPIIDTFQEVLTGKYGEETLKYLKENKLIENFNSGISINQKILLTMGLFGGDNEKFNRFIDFVEKDLFAENWEAHILEKYPHFQDPSASHAWEELKSILLKKYQL